jgi:hypothetical protein
MKVPKVISLSGFRNSIDTVWSDMQEREKVTKMYRGRYGSYCNRLG